MHAAPRLGDTPADGRRTPPGGGAPVRADRGALLRSRPDRGRAARPRRPHLHDRRRSAASTRTGTAAAHDIGKLAISNRILDKPARLTDAEFAVVRRHPLFTGRILERTPGFAGLAPLAAAHHERLDGSGYPHGLAGDELTPPMRILAVADVYEALTSERPYRPAMSSGTALEVMRPEVPHGLDGEAFTALEAVLEERRPETPAAHAALDDAVRADAVLGRRLH